MSKKKTVPAPRPWLKVEALSNDSVKMVISGYIGNSIYDGGTSSEEFCKALDQIDENKAVHLHVNSPGGSVTASLEIYNALKARKNTTAHVSAALSAGSIVALGCATVISPHSSVWMIHSPLVGTFGNEEEHQKSIKLLQAFTQSMCAVYAAETGQSEADIMDLMAAETWYTGAEAVEFGLADALEEDDDGDEEDDADPAARARMVMAHYRPPQKIRALLDPDKTISAALASGKKGAGPAARDTDNDNNNNEDIMAKEPTVVAAATPPTDPNLARFIEERKARITAEVKRRAESRIKNEDLDFWIDLAVNAETMAAEAKIYDQIEKLPKAAPASAEQPLSREPVGEEDRVVAGAALPTALGTCYSKTVDKTGHIVEIGVAPTKQRTPFAVEIRKLKTPLERVSAMKRDWAGLLNYCMELDSKAMREGKLPVAANTYSSTLITDNLVDTAITILTQTWASLSCFTRDFSVDRYKPLATAQVKFVTAGATTLTGTKSANITSFETGDSTAVPISVSLNHYSQPFHVGQDELMSGLRMENLLNINLATLANTITLAALQPLALGALNSAGSTVNYAAGTFTATAPSGTFGWTKDMPLLRGALKKSPLKNLVLDGSFYSFLTNQPGFYQPTSVGPRGDRVSTFGWNQIEENSIWPNWGAGEAKQPLRGFACNPQAIAVVAGLPQLQPNIPGNVLTETVVMIPGPDIYIACYVWFSLASRTLWTSYDVMFGAAGGDALAGALLFGNNGNGTVA